MLGLGLGVSKVSSLRSLAAKLLAKLKSRSTYYENNKDSKQVAQDLDTIDVLDKASILLTPTAYSDARVHSVKTYTGENALTGNSSTFDTGVGDWVGYGTGQVSHASTYLRVDVQTTEGGAQIPVNSLIQGGQVGKTIKVRVKLWVVSGESGLYPLFKVFLGGDQKDISLTPSPTYYDFLLKPTTTADLIIYKTNAAKSNGLFAIDDVSVVDVSSDFDFDRASSATRINSDGLVQDMQSITEPELVLNGDFEELGSELVTSTSSTDNWINARSNSVLSVVGDTVRATTGTNDTFGISTAFTTVIGKTYKINSFGATNNSSGSLIMRVSNTANLSPAIYQDVTTGGLTLTTSAYFVATATTTYIGFLVTIPVPTGEDYVETNLLSVQQVDPNEYWGTGGGWSLEQGAAVATSGSSTKLSQAGISSSGKVIKTTFTISNYGGSGSVFVDFGSSNSSAVSGNGTHTVIGTFDQDTFEILKSSDFEGKIDNISVKDITFSEDVDLARINYDSNGENGHWLLEPTSTNLITYSEDFSSGWAYFDSSTDANQLISPSGVLNASKFIEGTGSSIKRIINLTQSIVSGNNYTFSIFAKKGERDFITLTNNTGVADVTTTFDLTNGTIISGVGSIETFTNGWFRCTRSFTAAATVTSNFICQAFINAGSGISYQGDGTSGIYIWGVQLEALSYATSYIPTYGSTVTRATETLTGSGNSTLINSTEGVLYAEIAALSTTEGSGNISLSDGTGDNRIYIYYFEDDAISVIYNINSTGAVINNFTLSDITSYTKIAARWGNSNFSVWINGTEVLDVAASNFTSNTLDLLNLAKPDGSGQLEGKCKALAVFDEALTDDELELLTGITNYGSFNELAQANGYTII